MIRIAFCSQSQTIEIESVSLLPPSGRRLIIIARTADGCGLQCIPLGSKF